MPFFSSQKTVSFAIYQAPDKPREIHIFRIDGNFAVC